MPSSLKIHFCAFRSSDNVTLLCILHLFSKAGMTVSLKSAFWSADHVTTLLDKLQVAPCFRPCCAVCFLFSNSAVYLRCIIPAESFHGLILFRRERVKKWFLTWNHEKPQTWVIWGGKMGSVEVSDVMWPMGIWPSVSSALWLWALFFLVGPYTSLPAISCLHLPVYLLLF